MRGQDASLRVGRESPNRKAPGEEALRRVKKVGKNL